MVAPKSRRCVAQDEFCNLANKAAFLGNFHEDIGTHGIFVFIRPAHQGLGLDDVACSEIDDRLIDDGEGVRADRAKQLLFDALVAAVQQWEEQADENS